jgi:hypothetical protein
VIILAYFSIRALQRQTTNGKRQTANDKRQTTNDKHTDQRLFAAVNGIPHSKAEAAHYQALASTAGISSKV